MTTWTRERGLQHCGQCGQEIPAGDVLLRITFGGCKAKKYRCVTCAGPAPPELPAHIEQTPLPPIDLTRLGLLPLDFSRRDRAPGEEG
jgi:hypothetical protein